MTDKKSKEAIHFMMLAYQDYIAGRFLLNNNYIIQGITLASTSIEKYFKAMLTVLGIKFRFRHLDDLQYFKNQFQGTSHETIFDFLDDNFLLVMGKAYEFRYYNKIQQPDTVGFFVNQLIGELDYTVYALEKLFDLNSNGRPLNSHYARGVVAKCPDLFLNNYILNGQDKTVFMQSKSQAFGCHYDPNTMTILSIQLKEKMNVPYSGNIMLIDAKLESN